MKLILRIPKSILKGFIFIMLMMVVGNTYAQKERVQTAFIYQLTQLVEWCPQGKEGNFVVGVMGNESTLLAELKALNNRRVGSQQIEIKSFENGSDMSGINILFVPGSSFNSISQITSQLEGFCTLIISDQQGTASRGAGISAVYSERDSRLVLEVNRGFMRANSLNVSSRLYNLASNIY